MTNEHQERRNFAWSIWNCQSDPHACMYVCLYWLLVNYSLTYDGCMEGGLDQEGTNAPTEPKPTMKAAADCRSR
uniref:Uncharacterized protein n=1 Tax=Arundo donax TaxID=35708 RepID=A0A0A9B9A6_ARUDO